jgi:hypothetical protein
METSRVFERQEVNFYVVTEWKSYLILSNFTIDTESGALLLTAEIISLLLSLRNALRCMDERALCGRNLQSHQIFPFRCNKSSVIHTTIASLFICLHAFQN